MRIPTTKKNSIVIDVDSIYSPSKYIASETKIFMTKKNGKGSSWTVYYVCYVGDKFYNLIYFGFVGCVFVDMF